MQHRPRRKNHAGCCNHKYHDVKNNDEDILAKKLKEEWQEYDDPMLIQEPIPFAVNGYRRTSTGTANERFFSDLILVFHAEERASLLWMDLP
jgi:hypothetical protein